MSKPMNIDLIVRAQEKAVMKMTGEQALAFNRRKAASEEQNLMYDIQTTFQADAYTAYLLGKLNITELRALLFFDTVSNQNLLFSMVQTQRTEIILNNIRNMTGEKNLTAPMLKPISDFLNEYKSEPRLARGKNNSRNTH